MNKINTQNENYKPFSFHAIKVNVTAKKLRINQAIGTQNINIAIYYDEIQQTHTRA